MATTRRRASQRDTAAVPPAQTDALRVGEVVSVHTYARIERVSGAGDTREVELRTARNERFVLPADFLRHEAWASCTNIRDDDEAREPPPPVTRTEAVERLLGAGTSVFTVRFEKKVSERDVTLMLAGAHDADTHAKRRALARRILHGEERTLVGRLATQDPAAVHDGFGRVRVLDLDVLIPPHGADADTDSDTDANARGTALRLIDPRTILWVCVRGVRYTVKR